MRRRLSGPRDRRFLVDGKAPPTTSTPLTIISSVTVNLWARSDSLVESGGLVSQFTDRVASPHHFTAAGGARPALITSGPAGQPFIRTDGAATFMGSTFVPSTTGWLWIIARRTNTANNVVMFNSSAAGAARFALNTVATASLRMSNTTAANPVSWAAGVWARVRAKFTGSVADELKIGSTAPTSGTSAGAVGGSGGCWFGATGAGAAFFAGDFLEIMQCTAEPNPTELAALDAYVTSFWGGVVQV